MGVARLDVPTRLRRKTCLVCGYRGPELQGESGLATFICPRCCADLYACPPRSYAEMEGFDEADGAAPRGSRFREPLSGAPHTARFGLVSRLAAWAGRGLVRFGHRLRRWATASPGVRSHR